MASTRTASSRTGSAWDGGAGECAETMASKPTVRSGGVKSAGRTLTILEHLARVAGPVSLADLSVALDIPKSSLHALLNTLEARGWIERDRSCAQHYRLSVRALLVAAEYVESDDIVSLASGVLDRLSVDLCETIHLGRLCLPYVVYLSKRESRQPLRLYSAIGKRLPAHATGLGKAILADRADDELLELLPEQLPRLTDTTITDRQALLSNLADIRRTGVAVDDQENTIGLRCFAVAIGRTAPRNDAISCSVPVNRLDAAREREIKRRLLAARSCFERGGVSATG